MSPLVQIVTEAAAGALTVAGSLLAPPWWTERKARQRKTHGPCRVCGDSDTPKLLRQGGEGVVCADGPACTWRATSTQRGHRR